MDIKNNELFWGASIDEVKKGYVEKENEFICIICGYECIKGKIYRINSDLFDAKKALELHIIEAHQSMLIYLLNMNSTFTGITEIQNKVLTLLAKGLSDKDIAFELGIAPSTIRNHRFKLREKEKQAKLFLSIMDLLASNTNEKITSLEKQNLCDPHKTATTLDDRYNITDKEKLTVKKNHFDSNGALKSYPAKEKKKVIILEEITKNFKGGKIYTEKEINRIIERIYDDYATIRRALIEYGFIERSNDCSKYWLKD